MGYFHHHSPVGKSLCQTAAALRHLQLELRVRAARRHQMIHPPGGQEGVRGVGIKLVAGTQHRHAAGARQQPLLKVAS